jgi:hypothetical protein
MQGFGNRKIETHNISMEDNFKREKYGRRSQTTHEMSHEDVDYQQEKIANAQRQLLDPTSLNHQNLVG